MKVLNIIEFYLKKLLERSVIASALFYSVGLIAKHLKAKCDFFMQ